MACPEVVYQGTASAYQELEHSQLSRCNVMTTSGCAESANALIPKSFLFPSVDRYLDDTFVEGARESVPLRTQKASFGRQATQREPHGVLKFKTVLTCMTLSTILISNTGSTSLSLSTQSTPVEHQ